MIFLFYPQQQQQTTLIFVADWIEIVICSTQTVTDVLSVPCLFFSLECEYWVVPAYPIFIFHFYLIRHFYFWKFVTFTPHKKREKLETHLGIPLSTFYPVNAEFEHTVFLNSVLYISMNKCLRRKTAKIEATIFLFL